MFESVHEIFASALENDPCSREWLARALSFHPGQHLSICLSIELTTGLIASSDIGRLISSLTDPKDIPSSFSAAVQGDPELSRLLGAETPRLPSPSMDSYVRVLKLSSFVSHCLSSLSSVDNVDLNEAQEAYFPNSFDDLAHGLGLSYVAPWTTPRNILWVTSYEELSRVVTSSPHGMGSVANDALGLGHSNRGDDKPVLIGIKYPDRYQANAFKPTVYLADWRSGQTYYLSAPDDPSWIGWGQTRSCSGRIRELHERVHNGLSRLTDDFLGGVLGPIDDVGELDYQALIQEGLRRLDIARKVLSNGSA